MNTYKVTVQTDQSMPYTVDIPEGYRLVRNHKVRPSINDDAVSEDAYDFDANAEKEAAKRGQIVVWPEPNQLQIDIDSEEDRTEFYDRMLALDLCMVDDEDLFHLREDRTDRPCLVLVNEKKSKTEGHYHITLTFKKEFTEAERICFQFALGSDYVREMLNAFRLFRGVSRATRLFEPDPNLAAKNEAAFLEDFAAESEHQQQKTAVIPTIDDVTLNEARRAYGLDT